MSQSLEFHTHGISSNRDEYSSGVNLSSLGFHENMLMDIVWRNMSVFPLSQEVPPFWVFSVEIFHDRQAEIDNPSSQRVLHRLTNVRITRFLPRRNMKYLNTAGMTSGFLRHRWNAMSVRLSSCLFSAPSAATHDKTRPHCPSAVLVSLKDRQ